MEPYLNFFERLFGQLRSSDDYRTYKLQRTLQAGTRDHWQQVHAFNGDPFLVSFVKKSQVQIKAEWTRNMSEHPFRLEWTLDHGRKPVFDRVHAHRVEIEQRLGAELDWERKEDRGRSIIAWYYRGADSEDARIAWVLTNARTFIETLMEFANR